METKPPQPSKLASFFNDGTARGWVIGSWTGYIGAALLARELTGISISAATIAELGVISGYAAAGALIFAPLGAVIGSIWRQRDMQRSGEHTQSPDLTDHAFRGMAVGSVLALIPEIFAVIGLGTGLTTYGFAATLAGWAIGGAIAAYNMIRHYNAAETNLSGIHSELGTKPRQTTLCQPQMAAQPAITPEEMQQLLSFDLKIPYSSC